MRLNVRPEGAPAYDRKDKNYTIEEDRDYGALQPGVLKEDSRGGFVVRVGHKDTRTRRLNVENGCYLSELWAINDRWA